MIRINFPPTFQVPDDSGDGGGDAHHAVVKAKMASNGSRQKPSIKRAWEHTGTTTESDSGAEDPTSEHKICSLALEILITLYKAPCASGRSRTTVIGEEGRVIKKIRA